MACTLVWSARHACLVTKIGERIVVKRQQIGFGELVSAMMAECRGQVSQHVEDAAAGDLVLSSACRRMEFFLSERPWMASVRSQRRRKFL